MVTATRRDSFPLREIVTNLLGPAGQPWRVREDDRWCQVTPAGYPRRIQGWKVHLSATWLSAPIVLHRAAQVLVEHGCAFKFAADMDRVWGLTQKNAERQQAGKFLTAYPRDDDHLRVLAPLLDKATAGLPGPAILSDHPLRPGSLVHYRFGAYHGVAVLTNDATYEDRLEAPDGSLVEDARRPWFCPPTWVEPPFPGKPGRSPALPADPVPVLLAGRYQVHQAIRHSARGGVFRAVDRETGEEVVIKQARPHFSGMNPAADARDDLGREAAMLTRLAGITPRLVQLFEDGAHRFLVMASLPGESLGIWVRRSWQQAPWAEEGVIGPPTTETLAMAGRLADLVDAVHARGLVYRDLSPNNVIVGPDGTLGLIDAELAARPGEWVSRAHTPGFVAPELLDGAVVGPAAGFAADRYALGALLCHLVTGRPPDFTPDTGSDDAGVVRSPQQRIALLLRYASAQNPAAQRLAPAILGLTADDPGARWSTDRLREVLRRPIDPAGAGRPRATLEPELRQKLLTDGLAHLVDAACAASPDQLMASTQRGIMGDSCNVQSGVAGVLAVLVRASEQLGTEPLRAAVARLAGWLDRRRLTVPRLLPGLYFGRAGTAWALFDAARHLDDDGMAARALELATALPLRWPNPDITFGTAGAGMASLHLWYQTKEPVLLDRANAAVDHVLETAKHSDGRVLWQVPTDFDSMLAGVTQLGFAHGVAGIGAFLLAASQATGREDAREVAEQAGHTLAAAAVREGGMAYWPNGPSGPDESDMRYHWCSGASGVGTFLVRLWQATGDPLYRELAHEAAVSLRRTRWQQLLPACHGLPGNGEFLLDLAAAGDGPYRDWAEEFAAAIYVRLAERHGRLVGSDEPDGRVFLDFNTGYAGVVGFALRLVHGGPRWWMVDRPFDLKGGGEHDGV